ncbi:hypothetical protein D3C75_1259000 [compost metagenome]
MMRMDKSLLLPIALIFLIKEVILPRMERFTKSMLPMQLRRVTMKKTSRKL